ncbi:hypothetical protein [Hyphobacterium sp.]|uniref:hypothetical protein n=1 Tax=Hyphobacterium sp. TaxID=2004662 RepID=UPI003747E24E
MIISTLAAMALSFSAHQDASGAAEMQMELPPPPEPPVILDRSERRARPLRDHVIDRATNLERVVDQDGNPVGRWRREEGCVAERCANVVRDSETGEIAGFDGELQGGFVRTGRGDEIVRFRLTPQAREALLQQRREARENQSDDNRGRNGQGGE